MKKRLWLGSLIFLLIFTTACGSNTTTDSASKTTAGSASNAANGSAPQPLIKLKVGYDGFSMTTGPLNYGYQKGIFKKYGLDIEPVFINGGSTLTQAAVGGSVDIAQNGYSPAAESIVAGSDLVFIGGISNKLPFQMVVKSNINGAADLKGKKVAISKFGSSTDQAAEIALKSLGLSRSDVTFLQLGGSGDRLAAAASGQIDASMEQYPTTDQLLKKGFKVLVDVTDIAGDYPNTAYVAKKDYIAKHPDTVKKFMMAISESIHEYKKNKEEGLKLTAEFLKINDAKDLESAYNFYTTKIYPDIPKPSVKGIQLVLDQIGQTNAKAQSIKPEQIIDTTAIDALEKEGFYKNLLK